MKPYCVESALRSALRSALHLTRALLDPGQNVLHYPGNSVTFWIQTIYQWYKMAAMSAKTTPFLQ
jgi:hypothetical protein